MAEQEIPSCIHENTHKQKNLQIDQNNFVGALKTSQRPSPTSDHPVKRTLQLHSGRQERPRCSCLLHPALSSRSQILAPSRLLSEAHEWNFFVSLRLTWGCWRTGVTWMAAQADLSSGAAKAEVSLQSTGSAGNCSPVEAVGKETEDIWSPVEKWWDA
jgi:hypothetical protein